MPNHKITVLLLTLFLYAGKNAVSQTSTKTDVLRRDAAIQAQKEKVLADRLTKLAAEKGWPLIIKGRNNAHAILVNVDALGLPIYLSTEDISSAATIRTNRLWTGGGLGLNLSGSSNSLTGKLGLWDGGRVLTTHVELTGRISQRDNPTGLSDHSTHVAGIMMASGQYAPAKGMAYGLKELACFDFAGHLSEMFTAGQTGMLVSNHSYGAIAGWYYNEGASRWEFWGQANTTEDYKFGFYSEETQVWDSIAYNAPNYLIVKSAGNNRDMNGPAVGTAYWRYNTSNVMASAGNRPAGISSNDGYDIISTYGGAKNVLTVGGIEPIEAGYTRPQDVKLATFSSWGPTDDGRIKPDVVAAGVDVISSISSSDNSYASYSGTSMATPAAAGSVLLLQEYYGQLHGGAVLRSASLKGIVIHTADESGLNPGPDYQHGWGLINMEKAAAVITSNNTDKVLQENILTPSQVYTYNVVASGKGPLMATICWTDPKGAVENPATIDNPSKKLVNDLDIRIKKGSSATYMPWILNPASPAQAAGTGDNTLDNVERIEVPDAIPGETYTIEVSHKGTLERGSQAYSLIVSGVGGTVYCTSAPTGNQGARIDSVSFGGIKKANPAGCTTYTNYTNISGDVEGNSTAPLFVRLSSCDASVTDKMVKAFIDINSDGDFNDAGELIATSGVINGNSEFVGNATIPGGLITGNYTILRIVVVETNNAANVQPCGTYTRGETQDYRIRIVAPSTDAGIFEVAAPFSNICPGTHNYVTVRIRNYGTADKTNVPVTVTVKDAGGNNVIPPLNETFRGVLPAYGSADYTLQTPFTAVAGTTYTITATSGLAGDQNSDNNQKIATIVTEGLTGTPTGEAELCSNDSVVLKTNATGFDTYMWYSQPAATTPIAYGAQAGSKVITADKKYYLGKNEQVPAIGPATNNVLSTTGSYQRFNAYFMNFTNTSPVIIESARMYIGNPNQTGKVNVILARNITWQPDNSSYSYVPEAIVTLDVYNTDPTPVAPPAVQAYDATDQGAIFNLNIPVVNPGAHSLIILQENGDNATFFRNTNIATNPYDIGIPGLFTITGNLDTRVNPATWRQNYYFFYDMRLRWADCPGTRATITASTGVPPVITWNGTTFTSNVPNGNQWYRNGEPVSGATDQTYTPNQSGVYKSVLTTTIGCLMHSNEINATVTGIPNIDPAEIGLKVLPNPSDGRFMVDFTVTTRSNLGMRITNMLGQDVWQKNVPNFIGQYRAPVEATHLTPGVYLLKIHHNNRNYVKKLIIR